MPALDYRAIGQQVTEEIGKGIGQVLVRSEAITSTIVKRSVSHSALETLGVLLTLFIGVGGYMFYAIKYQS